MVFSLGAQSARRRAPTAPRPCRARTPRPVSVRWSMRRRPPLPNRHPGLSSRTTRRARTGRLRRLRRPSYAAAAVPWPCHCHAAACCLGAHEDLPTALSLAIKAGPSPSHAGAQRYQAAIAAVLVPTVKFWLRPLAPPSRVAPTSPRTPRNFSLRLFPPA
jgi:hypothetical protein